MYCSEACKKRAKRMIAKIEREAADAARVPKKGRLGKRTTEFPAPLPPAETSTGENPATETGVTGDASPDGREADPQTGRDRRSKERRSRRYADRRTLWQITTDRTCKGCGRTVMDSDSGVILAQTAEGNSLVLGLMKCGKIWLCPVCSAKIRHGRAEEITRAVVSWIEQGGRAYLVTFTARHAATDKLTTLMDALQGTRADTERGIKRKPGAYQRLITGGTWAGRRASDGHRAADREGIRDRVGYIGMIRATEVTVGQANGWHPHIHAIVFVGGRTEGERGDKQVMETFEPSPSALTEWQDQWRGVWTSHLAKVDPQFKPSDKHGVDFKPLETVRDAEDLGKYIAKLQDGDKGKNINPANEVARGDLKQGRHGNMTPFQLLGRIGDLMGGVPEDDADGHGSLQWCLALWLEYETATKGRRAIEWTRYLRPLLGLDGGDSEDDDMDLLFEVDGASEIRAGVHVQTRAWHKVTSRGLDLAATEAVEGRTVELDAVVSVVTMAGASSGSVRLLTTGEITEAWETTLTKLAERRENAAARRRVESASTPQE
jgi:hypothetical protein